MNDSNNGQSPQLADEGCSPDLARGQPADLRSHIRSCIFCRTRKIKCDRQSPCSNCVRQGASCTYPPGPGRAPKGSCKPNARILERLLHMENLVQDLKRRSDMGDTGPKPRSGVGLETTTTPQHQDRRDDEEAPNEHQLGRLVIENSKSCYVSNIFWAYLGDQIEELRDLLHEPGTEYEDNVHGDSFSTMNDQPLTPNLDTAIMGFRSLAHSLHDYHPSMSQAVALLGIFQENVVPVVHIFHMPTLVQMFWDAIASLNQPNKDMEALLFAIYFSAVISMPPERCLHIMGVPHAQASHNLLFATQQALARANLLGTQSMTVLQSAVLFLSALRNEDEFRTTRSLTSLVHHIARAMGLHRDGTSFGLTPLEVELRRRLWWHVCLLDIRSSEYHGCEPIVQENTFDTRFPLNINDRDLTAGMAEPPVEREEATEMTFCLIRCESIRVVWKITYHPTSLGIPGQHLELSYQEHSDLVEDLRRRLKDRVQRCDISQPILFAAATVARLITARTWLVVHYPLTRQPNQTSLPADMLWQRLFQTSTEILELSLQFSTNKDIARWAWHSETHMQWHAVALVLSMVCTRPPSPDCDRAWDCVTAVYDRWLAKRNERMGIWRPIKRLMAKARYVREMQSLDQSEATWQYKTGQDSSEKAGVPLQASQSFRPSPPVLTSSVEANIGTHRPRTTDWLSLPPTFSTAQEDSTVFTGLETPCIGNIPDFQNATTSWNFTLRDLDLDLDLVQFGLI